MRILSIETSCDETAVSVLDCRGDFRTMTAAVLGNALYSQAEKHAQFGGVYPSLAKREHSVNLIPLTKSALSQAGLFTPARSGAVAKETQNALRELLTREEELYTALIPFLAAIQPPSIDAIAVTHGPGLEPALWVGLNFAKALAIAWDLPLIPVNHLEGHIVSALMQPAGDDLYALEKINFPAIALIISGGHTELVAMHDFLEYDHLGGTRDDAVGEAFDKVARLLGLEYPGGIHLSRLAEDMRSTENRIMTRVLNRPNDLPRPMITAPNCDFSFSGLKTAVLYKLRNIPELTDDTKRRIARDFEDAVADVLVAKTDRALSSHAGRTLLVGGGVAANKTIRTRLMLLIKEKHPDTKLLLPPPGLTGDNAIMIGMAAYFRSLRDSAYPSPTSLRAEGTLRLSVKRTSN